MLTTIIFFFALVISIITFIRILETIKNNNIEYDIIDLILSTITCVIWSWLFYLLH